jgi:hypothetical protein
VFSYYLCNNITGWTGIILRTITFSTLFGLGIIFWELTPDASQLLIVFKERIKK